MIKILFVLVASYGYCLANVEGPIVNTTLGQVRGVPATDGDYVSFLGIPYARVDSTNPFGAALPQPPFDGIFEANDDSAICPQQEEFNNTIVGSLDCLHLNIFVPSSASLTNRLPVLVTIYGGGFTIGFYGRFLYGPKYLVRHDIILITLNYRLGPYGFMCTDSELIPGNEGLKDQLKALRWVKENIASFGGDPDNITIGGNSAGGISVDHHMRRKLNESRLFHKGILQSGAAIFQNSLRINAGPLLLSQLLGYQASNISKTVLEIGMPFGICVEEEFDGIEPFVTEQWMTASEIPSVSDIPIIIGYNNDEMLSLFPDGLGNVDLFNEILRTTYDIAHEDFNGMVNIVRQFYIGDESISADTLLTALEFASDLVMIHPIHRTLETYLNNDVGNLYLYQFSYDGNRNFIKHKDNITIGGAVHADEIAYLYDISYMDEPSPEDHLVIDRMTTLWANFVRYGDPTPQTSELLPWKWQPINKESPQYYIEINKVLSVGTRLNNERITFMDLFQETNQYIHSDIPSHQ